MVPAVGRSNRRKRIVVVGPCASGKTTLVERLVAAGFDAYACAQEHSEISSLWQHLNPDGMVALDVSLEALRERRGQDWPESIYLTQRRRLAAAWEAAEVVIDTTTSDEDQTFHRAIEAIRTIEKDR